MGSDGPLLVLTGAGVSAASGIPAFRGTDPNAIWARDVMEHVREAAETFMPAVCAALNGA